MNSKSDTTSKRPRSREKDPEIGENDGQSQATCGSFVVKEGLNNTAAPSPSEDRVLTPAPAAIPNPAGQINHHPSVESDPLMSLQFYGSYNSYPDFYQILPENVAYEELDPSLPTQMQSTFLDRAGDLFGNCFSCLQPSDVPPPTAQQVTTTKEMIDDLLDDVSPPKQRKRGGSQPNKDNEA